MAAGGLGGWESNAFVGEHCAVCPGRCGRKEPREQPRGALQTCPAWPLLWQQKSLGGR